MAKQSYSKKIDALYTKIQALVVKQCAELSVAAGVDLTVDTKGPWYSGPTVAKISQKLDDQLAAIRASLETKEIAAREAKVLEQQTRYEAFCVAVCTAAGGKTIKLPTPYEFTRM